MINSRNAEKFGKSGNLSYIGIIRGFVWTIEGVWFLSVSVEKQASSQIQREFSGIFQVSQTCIVFVSMWLTVQFYMIVPSKPVPDLACFSFVGAAAS